MAISVILPNALQPYAGYNDRVPLEAATVGEAIQKLLERYPDLADMLPADFAAPPPGYAIFRRSKDVRHLQGLDTSLEPGDRITIVVPQGDL
jgi:molybdopterin synthase sulfur carrier subunit